MYILLMFMFPYDKNEASEEACKNCDFYFGTFILSYDVCSERKLLKSVWYAHFPFAPGVRLSKYKLGIMTTLMSALRRFGTSKRRLVFSLSQVG